MSRAPAYRRLHSDGVGWVVVEQNDVKGSRRHASRVGIVDHEFRQTVGSAREVKRVTVGLSFLRPLIRIRDRGGNKAPRHSG